MCPRPRCSGALLPSTYDWPVLACLLCARGFNPDLTETRRAPSWEERVNVHRDRARWARLLREIRAA